jgi:hypothetical protein
MFKSIVVFEGPDNSGKSTQVDLVATSLKEKFKREDNKFPLAFCTKFPNYTSMRGKLIKHMLYNPRDYNLRSDIKSMDLFSDLQLEDKLNTMEKITRAFKSYEYLFVDRYTLSSRIYDGVSRFLRCYHFYFNDIKNTYLKSLCRDWHDAFINDKHDTISMCQFVSEWIFNLDTIYHNNNYLKDKIELGYSMLEHDFYNIKYVYFKSCKAIERLTKETRKLDQYENNSVFNNIVKDVYNFMPYYRDMEMPMIENRSQPDIAEDKSWIKVDTTKILSDFLHIKTEENKLSDNDEEKIYNYCKENPSESIKLIRDNITNNLYTILKE